MNTLVHQHGLRAPIEGEEAVRRQLWLGHLYYNALLEWSRARRSLERDLEEQSGLHEAVRATVEANDVLEARVQALNAERAATRSRSDTRLQREAVAEARSALKIANAHLRETRATVREVLRPQLDQISRRWNELVRGPEKYAHGGLRGYSGLRHGTYTRIEEAVQQACRMTPLWDENGTPKDPRFHRWTHEGAIGV